MKKNFYLLAISLLILCGHNISFADGFNSVHTSDGNYVIAVGDAGKIFRSVNGGETWAGYIEPSANFKSVYTFGNDVWISDNAGKVYKSSKSTTILSSHNTGVTTSLNSVIFVNENIGYTCGDNGVVLKTVNGGTDWAPANSGIASVRLNSVSFKDALNGVVAGDNGMVYTTVNGGTSWSPESVGSSRNILDAKYFSDGIALAGEWGTLILKNDSFPWNAVATRINTDIRGISGTSMSDLHVCGGGGFIRNNTTGSVNFLNFEKNPMMANLVDITYYNNKGFAVSSLNNAVIRTIDGGTSWQLPAGTSVTYNWVAKPGAGGNFLGNNLALHPTDRNTVFIAFGNQIFRSRDKGEVWSTVGTPIPSGSTPHSFFVSPLDTNIWLVATEASPDKVYRTTNYGSTWTQVLSMNFSSYGQPLEMDQNNPHNFYFAPDNGGFYKSTDDGATFTNIFQAISGTGGNFRSPCDILIMWDTPNVMFLADGITGSGLATLFKSRDGGATWTLVHTNSSSSEIPSMCNTVFDKSTFWCTEWPGSTIYKTTNYGDDFNSHHTNAFSGWGSDICHEDPTMIVTGSWSNKATISADGGETWTDISGGLGGHGGGIMVPDKGYILAHQGSSIYKLSVVYSVTTSVSENNISSVPKSFNLSQNYPNPFNPTTRIAYDLPKSGNVLKIYNELGKEVNTLVNSFKNAGSYEITFDASSLSSGIYFYKLEADGLVNTKKMLLVK